jgi:hypothetical protein
MGLSTAERAYIRFVERVGLDGLDDSEEGDSEEEGDKGGVDEGGYNGDNVKRYYFDYIMVSETST